MEESCGKGLLCGTHLVTYSWDEVFCARGEPSEGRLWRSHAEAGTLPEGSAAYGGAQLEIPLHTTISRQGIQKFSPSSNI